MFTTFVLGLLDLALRFEDRLEDRRKEEIAEHSRALRAELEDADRKRRRQK